MIAAMKKNLIAIIACLLLGLGFTACKPSLTGTWVEPAEENSVVGEVGFTLQKDGTVTPINMGYREYNAWEKVGDQLILLGDYKGTNPHAFADTLWIEELTKEHLILKDFGNYTVTYQRVER